MALGLAYAGLKTGEERLFWVGYIGYTIPLLRAFIFDLGFLQGIERIIALSSVIIGVIILQFNALEFKNDIKVFEIYNVAWVVLFTTWIAREIYEYVPRETQNVVLAVSWALFSILLIIYGIMNKRKIFNWMGVVLFGIVIGKIILLDLSQMENIHRVFALIIVGVLALVGSFLFVKNRDKIKEFM